jgi:hypothetical protein
MSQDPSLLTAWINEDKFLSFHIPPKPLAEEQCGFSERFAQDIMSRVTLSKSDWTGLS